MGVLDIVGSQQYDKRVPATLNCPHCGRTLKVDLTSFNENFSKFVSADCPHCRGQLFYCCLLLGDSTPVKLGKTLQGLVSFLKEQTK